MQIVKTISKISISTILFILIISKPVISDYATRIKYSIDTGVITYEERKFILDNYPKYYIEYRDNVPYIVTNIKAFNEWNFNNIDANNVIYEIKNNNLILYNYKGQYVKIYLDVEPSKEYKLTFNIDLDNISDYSIRLNIILEDSLGNTTYLGNNRIDKKDNEFIIQTLSDTKKIRFTFYRLEYTIIDMEISNFMLIKEDIEIIDRPAKTYIKEHAPYDYIGHKVIGGFMDLVSKINKPKEFIKELTSEVKEFILRLII